MEGAKIIAGMLALLLAVSVTACGSSQAQEQDTSVPSETNAQETESTEAMGETELLAPEEIAFDEEIMGWLFDQYDFSGKTIIPFFEMI